ncbi:MAG: hypothetical protein ABIN48_00210 [Ginsengibacter sp.]
MPYFRNLPLLIVFVLMTQWSLGQQSGGNPPSVKWNQINTPHSRIIFAKGLDSTASRVANIISFVRTPTQKSIGNLSRKINIVLQNKTVVSNGYVGLAPFRSEFFLTPPQNSFDLGSLPWTDMLALHEYRHVEQYSNFDVGVSHLMKVVFGDGGLALANGAAVPDWFYEGDAVFSETNLSKQGRGSMPSFYNGFKAIWKDGKKYNWMQLRNGSLKNYTPNHYQLGYMLVAYGREKYGEEFWKNVTHDAASYKGLIYPFQKAIKTHSGISYKNFRKDALGFFKEQLNAEDDSAKLKPNKERYINEQYASFNEEGDLVFIKNSFDKTPSFVLRNKNGKDQKIRTSDFTLDPYFSYNNNKIVYINYRPDLRWGNREYNEIKVLDIVSGKQQTVTKKSRYFSPDISKDGKIIVAVSQGEFNEQSLQIINTQTGEILNKLLNEQKLIYTHPKFTDNNKVVAAIRDSEGKMSVAEIDFEKNETNYLLPFTYNVIGFPVVKNDTLYFSSSYLKKDELFAYTFSDKRIFRINNHGEEGVGKYHPSVNDEEIAWHTFTSNGNKIVRVSKNNLSFEEIPEKVYSNSTSNFGINALGDTNADLLSQVPDETFEIKKYRKSFQFFNFHSIVPDISDPLYSISLLGENILNTFQSELSVSYDRAEGYKRFGFSGTYNALFPYLTGGVNYTVDRRFYRYGKPVYLDQLEPYAGVKVPLNLSKGRSFTFLTAGSQYVFNKSFFKGVYKDSFPNRSYGYLNHYLSLSHQIQKSTKQIFPQFAQTLRANYKSALNNLSGNQALLNATVYFPGIFKNNSFVVNGAYLTKDSLRQISFSSGFPFSRGYEAATFYKMYKWGVNYHFPLLYPDAGVGNILYVLRVRANLFYDATYVEDFNTARNKVEGNFRSAGTEITFDTKWWNQVKVSFGFRYSYLLDKDVYANPGQNRWEIILPVNIFNR